MGRGSGAVVWVAGDVPLANLVVHAVVQAFAEAIGASGTAHRLALGLWVTAPERAVFSGPVAFGSGVAVVVAMRARPPLGDGASTLRALSRPRSLFSSPRAREALVIGWISAVSAIVGVALAQASGGGGAGDVGADAAPRSIAIGLGLSGLSLFSGALVSRSRDRGEALKKGRSTFEAPSWIAATLAGAAHALGMWPGVSRVGAAAAVLLALGVKPQRAMEIALAATVPLWWFQAVASIGGAGGATFGSGTIAAALFGFLGAYAAVAAIRALAAKRALVALPLWMIPLACAIFAYGRALPSRAASAGGRGPDAASTTLIDKARSSLEPS